MIDRRAALLAFAGLAGCVVGLVFVPRDALAAWLVCWLAWGAIPLGALGASMMLALVPGSWRDLYAGPLSLAAGLVPLVAVLALPLLLGLKLIYPWADPAVAATLPSFKAAWLSTPVFAIREIVILAVLSGLSWLLLTAERGVRSVIAGVGLVLYALLASLVGIDFGESTEPHFHSSIYGLLALTGQWLEAVAFGILFGLRAREGRVSIPAGGVLATAILLWAYMHAMQYIVIWSGNIPGEAHWYIERGAGAWRAIGWLGFAFQAILPFVALLAPGVRTNPRRMRIVAAAILLAAPLQQAWMILPGLEGLSLAALPLTIAASAVMLGLAWAVGGLRGARSRKFLTQPQ